jgi:hypothetical protein
MSSAEEAELDDTNLQAKNLKKSPEKKVRLKKKDRPFESYIGLQTLTQGVGKIQTDETGSTNKFDFVPLFNFGARFGLSPDFSLGLELAQSLPKSGEDSEIKKYYTLLSVPFNYHLGQDWVFNLHTGFFFTHITGPGGTKNVPNGTGTSDFFLPEGTSSAMNYIFGTGVQYLTPYKISVRADIFTFNTISSSSRYVNYTIGLQYHLGEFWKD